MAILRTLPTSPRPRVTLVDEAAVPVMALDGVSTVTLLAIALAPTVFMLTTTLQMFGVHGF